jgi:PAS domain S-box-containing protein
MTSQDTSVRFDALLRHSADVVLALDEAGTIAYHTPSSETHLGYAENELADEPALEHVHPLDRTAVADSVRDLERGDTATAQFRVRHRGGRWVPVEAAISAPEDPSVAAYVVDLRVRPDDVRSEGQRPAGERSDVGALHELYQIASATEPSFETKRSRVLELGRGRLGLPYGFVTRITEDTQTIVAATGDHDLLQPGESCPIEESYCRKTIRSEGLLALFDAAEEGFAADPAYDRFGLGCYIGGKLVVDGQLYGTMCFAGTAPRDREFSDTERAFVELASRWLSYELEQRQYRAELERQNDRLERFASVVSHDLRNPLSVVEGRLEIAREQRDDENLRTAADALDRAFDLIDEALEFARLGQEVTETEPLTLADCAREAWEMVEDDGVTLSIEDEAARVAADRDRLQRLLENLFRNSLEHGGPELTTVRVGAASDGFYVEDDGVGIPAEDRSDVFESGFTTASEGTGFGLSIVEQIAQAHGWSVTVEESVDGGARFEFYGTDPTAG